MKTALLTLLALSGVSAYGQTTTTDPTQVPPPSSGQNTLTLPTLPDVLGRLNFTDAIDFFGKGKDGGRKITNTQAALYRFNTYENFLPTLLKGRFKTNLDVDAVLGASGGGAAMGFAGVVSGNWGIPLTTDSRLSLKGTLGPALLYNTDGKGMHLGLVLGLGFSL